LHLTDLSVPLKKASVGAIITLINSISSTKTKLSLERCDASDQLVSGMLRQLTGLKVLCLNEMGLTASHISTIPKLLESTNTRRLSVLHMRGNNLGIDGAMAIAQGLIDNTTLKLLDLSSNRLGSKGTMLLCEALRDNTTL
jgi:Ran GTPase-activating protein (RanGAP) involved in mRNA processing and transport